MNTKSYLLHFLSLALFLNFSCTSPKVGDQALNLNQVDLDFNVGYFYGDALQEAKMDQEHKAARAESDRTLQGASRVEVHKIYTAPYSAHKKYIGMGYKILNKNSGKNLSYLKDWEFNNVEMLQSPDENFMALCSNAHAFGKSQTEAFQNKFQNLVKFLTAQYGAPEVKKDAFLQEGTLYNWQLNDRLIALTYESDVLNSGHKSQPIAEFNYYMVHNAYLNIVRDDIIEGPWVML